MGKVWKKIRPVRHFIGGYVYSFITVVLGHTPMFISYRIAYFTGKIAFFMKTKSIRRIIDHLNYAYGEEKVTKDLTGIARRVCINLPRGFMESFRIICQPPETIARSVEITGLEHLDAALSTGNGVIAISAHLGNFLILGPALGLAGYPYNVVVKDPPDKIIAEIWRQGQINSLNKPIPTKPPDECVKKHYKNFGPVKLSRLLWTRIGLRGFRLIFLVSQRIRQRGQRYFLCDLAPL